jgi:hypothetical protein
MVTTAPSLGVYVYFYIFQASFPDIGREGFFLFQVIYYLILYYGDSGEVSV